MVFYILRGIAAAFLLLRIWSALSLCTDMFARTFLPANFLCKQGKLCDFTVPGQAFLYMICSDETWPWGHAFIGYSLKIKNTKYPACYRIERKDD